MKRKKVEARNDRLGTFNIMCARNKSPFLRAYHIYDLGVVKLLYALSTGGKGEVPRKKH